MKITWINWQKIHRVIVLSAFSGWLLAGCGGGGDGPAIEARPQTLQFVGAAITLQLPGSATVVAKASSDLPIRYSSITPTVCSVDGSTGVVSALATGVCSIAANQSGNTTFAQAPQAIQTIPVVVNPSQTIRFAAAPELSWLGTATVSAVANSGLAVSFNSATPSVCAVNEKSGLVTSLAAGTCTITADQAGDANYHAAPQAMQSLPVSVPSGITVPGAPAGVTATVANAINEITVSIGATDSGGSPITGYTVTSIPAGITATASASPVSVTCPSTCSGYAFQVMASNRIGQGAPSAASDVLTNYNVVETFYEPDTQPRDSIFIGSFTFNSTTRTVLNLHGILSESMTGSQLAYPADNMVWLPLNNQLSAVSDAALGGVLVTTFLNSNTSTFSTMSGGDGWSPQAGVDIGGVYAGFPKAAQNPGNAYAMIFVNTDNPLAPLTPAQLNKLAYADCAPGGMMGAVCMTGTTVAGYGAVGTMSGYPVSQKITKKP
jgi:hypothetical protein